MTFPPKDTKGLITWVVILAVVGSLGYWWYTSELPLSTWIGNMSERSDERATGGTATGGSGGATPSSIQGNRDVVSIIAMLPSVSSFRSYFNSSGVATALSRESEGPYTIFVPTNTSVARLAKGTISGLSASEQTRLVSYHVVVGREVDVDALRSGSLTALSKDVLNFNYGTDGVARVNSAAIIGTYQANNGIVYVIDGVLLPPKPQF